MKNKLFLLVFVAIVFFVSFHTKADYEAATFGVDNYDIECCTWAHNLSYMVASAKKVGEAFVDIGYDQVNVKINKNTEVDGRDWQDFLDDDVDPYGTDFADAVFYAGHGMADYSNNYSYFCMGDRTPGEGCIAISPDIEFAEGGPNEEANVLFTVACQSMEHDIALAGGYDDIDQGGSGTQFTAYNGFHGANSEFENLPGNLYDYVIDTKYNGIGLRWVVDFTIFDFHDHNYDLCATYYGWASSYSNWENMYLNGGFEDFKDTGLNHDHHWYAYVCNCDPDISGKLPDC